MIDFSSINWKGCCDEWHNTRPSVSLYITLSSDYTTYLSKISIGCIHTLIKTPALWKKKIFLQLNIWLQRTMKSEKERKIHSFPNLLLIDLELQLLGQSVHAHGMFCIFRRMIAWFPQLKAFVNKGLNLHKYKTRLTFSDESICGHALPTVCCKNSFEMTMTHFCAMIPQYLSGINSCNYCHFFSPLVSWSMFSKTFSSASP